MNRPSSQLHQERLAWLDQLADDVPDESCRDWPGAVNSKGYPVIKVAGRQTKVGHVVLERTGRPRPGPDAWQLHSCDRPRCVAPWHLRWGTSGENVADKVTRGRSWRPQGEVNRQSKLNDDAVRDIRSSDERYRVLAERYGVHIKTIAKVRARKIWAHVEDAA